MCLINLYSSGGRDKLRGNCYVVLYSILHKQSLSKLISKLFTIINSNTNYQIRKLSHASIS